MLQVWDVQTFNWIASTARDYYKYIFTNESAGLTTHLRYLLYCKKKQKTLTTSLQHRLLGFTRALVVQHGFLLLKFRFV